MNLERELLLAVARVRHLIDERVHEAHRELRHDAVLARVAIAIPFHRAERRRRLATPLEH